MAMNTFAKLVFVVVAVLPLTASRGCDYSVDLASECNMLYQQMENALLGDPENLYRLRRAFFPNRAEPDVLGVTFSLRLDNVSSELCTGATNSDVNSLQVSQQFFWTSSAVFSALNPRILDLLLPEILYLLNPVTDSYYDTSVSGLLISLDIDSLSCMPSSRQIKDALMDLTAMLKAYANRQGRLDSWDSEYRGYSNEQYASEVAIAFTYVPTVLLLALLVLAVYRFILTETFRDYWQKVTTKEKPSYHVFVIVYIMVSTINFIFFIMEVIGMLLWSRTRDTTGVGTTVSKVIHILISCLLSAVVAAFAAQSVVQNVPGGLLRYAEVCFTCCIGLCCSKESTVTKAIVAMSFLVFAEILGWCLIPTFVLVLAEPIETIAVVSLAVSLFLFTAIAMSIIVLIVEGQMPGTTSPITKRSTVALSIFIIFFGGCVATSLIGLYLYIIEEGANTGGLSGTLITFIPTIITTVAAYFGKQALKNYVPGSEDKLSRNDAEAAVRFGTWALKKFEESYVSDVKHLKETTKTE